jgi:hypothetical protein
MPRARPRAIFYIDGFNLYSGLHRRADAKGLAAPEHRWLNLSKLAEFLMSEADVVQVRYVTSLIKRRTDDPDAGNRQAVFLRALATLPNLTVHLGHFQRNLVWRRRVDNLAKSVGVIDVKEKGSDVNLAAFPEPAAHALADLVRRRDLARASEVLNKWGATHARRAGRSKGG